MQLLADIVYCLNKDNIVTIDDLYKLKESDIINIINNSRLSNIFKIWSNSKRLYSRNNYLYIKSIKRFNN